MSASEVAAYGQVWRYTGNGGEGSLYMLVAPSNDGWGNRWSVLFLGASLIAARAKSGHLVLDSMAGLPGPDNYRDRNWERVA